MNSIVIGIGFGDEGKGRVVDWLCNDEFNQRPSLTIRFSGGHQACHGVLHDSNYLHGFSNFGSGTLRNVPSYFSKYCTIDPVGVMNEYEILRDNRFVPFLYIDRQCPIVTPYDKSYNTQLERANQHGTCGVGFGTTLEREEQHYSLLFEDLYYPSVLKIKLEKIKNFYKNVVKIHDDYIIDEFLRSCEKIIDTAGIKRTDINEISKNYGYGYTLIFEGSQGLLLDKNIGFFPHVTRSNIDLTNIYDGFSHFLSPYDKLYLVTRGYQTRHGHGPMTNEGIPLLLGKNNFDINNDDGPQGIFRSTVLDLDLLKYGINKSESIRNFKNKILVVTCLDLMEEYCFTHNGELKTFSTFYDMLDGIRKHLEIPEIHFSFSPKGPILPYSKKS